MNPTERHSVSLTPSKCYVFPSSSFPLSLSSLLAVLLTLILLVICSASNKLFWLVDTEKRNVGGNIRVGEKWKFSFLNIYVNSFARHNIGSMILG